MGEANRRAKTKHTTPKETQELLICYFNTVNPPGFIAFNPNQEPEFIRDYSSDRNPAENRADYRWNIKPLLLNKASNPDEIEIGAMLQPFADEFITTIKNGLEWRCLLCGRGDGNPMPDKIVVTAIMPPHCEIVTSTLCKECCTSHPWADVKANVRKTLEVDFVSPDFQRTRQIADDIKRTATEIKNSP